MLMPRLVMLEPRQNSWYLTLLPFYVSLYLSHPNRFFIDWPWSTPSPPHPNVILWSAAVSRQYWSGEADFAAVLEKARRLIITDSISDSALGFFLVTGQNDLTMFLVEGVEDGLIEHVLHLKKIMSITLTVHFLFLLYKFIIKSFTLLSII